MTNDSTSLSADETGYTVSNTCGPKESTLQAILQFAATYHPIYLKDGSRIPSYLN